MMQSSTLHIETCNNLVNDLIKHFATYRSDENFEEMLRVEECNTPAHFPAVQNIRPRRKPKQFEYEQRDEAEVDPRLHFKFNFFNVIIDQTVSSLQSRFEQLEAFNNTFGFFNNLSLISENELLKNCKNLHIHLKDDARNEADIDGIDLFNEIKSFKLLYSEKCRELKLKAILQYLFENNLISVFPNFSIALRIYFTLPVSVASGERSFSKLKIIKII